MADENTGVVEDEHADDIEATACGTVTLLRLEPGTMFLRNHIGDGTTPQGLEFSVAALIPNGSLHVSFKDGNAYLLKLDSFIRAAIDAEEALGARGGD